MSYQDLAVAAGGSPGAGMAVGQYLAKTEGMPESVHRVLRSDGTISPGWVGEIGGPQECRALLESEGLVFDERGRADPSRRWARHTVR
jgi:alkylated DNA nucleotide flippase Atl1